MCMSTGFATVQHRTSFITFNLKILTANSSLHSTRQHIVQAINATPDLEGTGILGILGIILCYAVPQTANSVILPSTVFAVWIFLPTVLYLSIEMTRRLYSTARVPLGGIEVEGRLLSCQTSGRGWIPKPNTVLYSRGIIQQRTKHCPCACLPLPGSEDPI